MRVLHLCPGPEARSGIAAYGGLFRAALAREGVEIARLVVPVRTLNSAVDVARYARAAARAAAGFDLVHAELGGAALRELYGALAVQRSQGPPVCLTLHDPPRPVWWPFHAHAVRQRRALGWLVRHATPEPARRLERRVLSGSAAVFALSRGGARAAGPGVRAIEYPVAAAPASPPPVPLDGPLRIGAFGYWHGGKGMELVVEAVAALRAAGGDVHAHLWGSSSPTAGLRSGDLYRRNVGLLIEERGVGDAVTVDGHLPDGEMLGALRACHAVVLPYRTVPALAVLRSTSAAMHEALAAGTPVVAAGVRALDETVRDGDNGLLVAADDAAALAAALRRLHGDTALRARLRAGAQAHAAALDPSRCATAVLAGYAAALAQKRTPAAPQERSSRSP